MYYIENFRSTPAPPTIYSINHLLLDFLLDNDGAETAVGVVVVDEVVDDDAVARFPSMIFLQFRRTAHVSNSNNGVEACNASAVVQEDNGCGVVVSMVLELLRSKCTLRTNSSRSMRMAPNSCLYCMSMPKSHSAKPAATSNRPSAAICTEPAES